MMVWVLSQCRGNISFLLVSRSQFTGGWSNFQKGWAFQEEEESNIKKVKSFFLFFINQNYVTFCSRYPCFSRDCTKRDMPRIKLKLPCCFKYYDSDTRKVCPILFQSHGVSWFFWFGGLWGVAVNLSLLKRVFKTQFSFYIWI